MDMKQRAIELWCQHFNLDAALAAQPGTTLIPDADTKPGDWHSFWPVGERIVIPVAPGLMNDFEIVLTEKAADYPLQAEDMVRYWGQDKTTVETETFNVMEAEKFQPIAPASPFSVRQMHQQADKAVFEAFIQACPEPDVDVADVDITHKAAFGTFDGERLVALASMYLWNGFADIGILTDPAYRGRGTGKAAASALVEYLIPQDFVIFWRNETSNIGSGKIAQALGFTPLSTLYSLRRLSKHST